MIRLGRDANKITQQLVFKYDNFWTNLTEVNSVCLCGGSDHVFCTCQKHKGLMKVLGIMSNLTHCIPCRIHRDKNGLHDPRCLLSSYYLQFWSKTSNTAEQRLEKKIGPAIICTHLSSSWNCKNVAPNPSMIFPTFTNSLGHISGQ